MIFDTNALLDVTLKIVVACVLAGLIGFERESVQRPAGFRTHILVCVGATIVMITNIELIPMFSDVTSVNPGRFGAAVISGIGFLGAGTIIRQGASVKGLTTAASLWTVACLGLAIGSGLHHIAIIATTIILITLNVFSRLERLLKPGRNFTKLAINSDDVPGQLATITSLIDNMTLDIRSLKVKSSNDDQTLDLSVSIITKKEVNVDHLIVNISNLKGINSISKAS